MVNKIFKFYQKFFVKKSMYKFNKLLYLLGLRGMGILNYENLKISGEETFLKKYLGNLLDKEDITVVDVGANIGRYSIMVKEINKNAKVYAFEPHPKNFVILQKRTESFDITCLNFGCSNEEGTFKFYDYQEKDGSSHVSLYKDVIEKIHKSKSIEHEVHIVRLDDFVKSRSIKKIHLLKIDTEGNELNVLRGAMESLKKNIVDVIHFEFNEMNVISRTFFKDIYDLLPNYSFFRLLPDGMVSLGKYNPLFFEIYAYQNIIAVRNEIVERLLKIM